jgi:ribonuclease HII
MTLEMMNHIEETMLQKGYRVLCGVDEAGRGPLAGPVVAAAVVVPPEALIPDLDDSKKLSPARREAVFERIVQLGLPCAIGVIDHETIDRVNIHKASLIAMRKAVMDLKVAPDMILVDGNATIPNLSQPQLTLIGGDRCCRSIAAASVIAKVTRDRIMDRYEELHPEFSFSVHKGYPTPAHRRELTLHGPCEIHRRSFKPVADLIREHELVHG